MYNGVAGPFVMPPFATAAGTPLYNVAGLRPVKMEAADWYVHVYCRMCCRVEAVEWMLYATEHRAVLLPFYWLKPVLHIGS